MLNKILSKFVISLSLYYNFTTLFIIFILGQPGTPGLPGLPGQSYGQKPSIDYGKPNFSAGYPGSPGNTNINCVL